MDLATELHMARASSASDAVAEVARAAGLVVDPPADVLAEAAALVAEPGIDDPTLSDLRGLPFSTIDYPTSMDLDQAVHVEAEGSGWVVWYAIADAAHFVRRGSALEREALARGATYYLPGLTVPMLPAVLSEGIVSLLPDVDRRAVVFRLRVDAAGRSLGGEVLRARIRSRCKTSYEAVQAWVDGGAPPCADPAVLEGLKQLGRVGEARLRDGDARGVVRVRRAEVSVDVAGAEATSTFVALRDPRNAVERWNEQISLLANAEGAAILARRASVDPGVEPIYRVMEPPSPERSAALAERIRAIAEAHGLDLGWDPAGEPLATWVERLPDTPVGRAISRQVMLVGGRASYVAAPGPHAGVGAELYARFTAPMREIVGVYVHQELTAALWPSAAVPEDPAYQRAVIDAASRSRSTQRDLDHAVNERVLDQLFTDDLRTGRTRTATVMGYSRDKVHLLLDDPPIDVKWYFAHLSEQLGVRVRIGPDEVRLLAGNDVVMRVGDAIEVRVVRFDGKRKRWAFAEVG